MTTAPAPAVTPSAAPASPTLERRLAELRAVPLRFWALAVGGGLLAYAAMGSTPWHPFVSSNNESLIGFAGGLVRLLALGLGVAPLVALRWPVAATVLAASPLLLSVSSEQVWPFSVFLALVAVMMVAVWRSPRQAVAPGLAALLLVLTLVTSASTLVMPYGAVVEIGVYSSGFAERGLPFVFYTVAVGLAYGAALWMRSSALRARRLSTLDARAGAVEDRAVVVEERARLARDLHDVVAHHVSLIAVRAETAPYTNPDLPDEARHVLAEIAGEARAALDELRGVLGVLRRSDGVDGEAADDGPAALAPQPDLAGVAGLVERVRAAGVAVTLEGDLLAPVSGPVGYVGYRVVQEALTNARRHAPGLPVSVAVLGEGDRVRLRVTNPYLDQTTAPGGGSGLVGMRERVEALGGRLAAGVEGDLFVVEADLPRGAA